MLLVIVLIVTALVSTMIVRWLTGTACDPTGDRSISPRVKTTLAMLAGSVVLLVVVAAMVMLVLYFVLALFWHLFGL